MNNLLDKHDEEVAHKDREGLVWVVLFVCVVVLGLFSIIILCVEKYS